MIFITHNKVLLIRKMPMLVFLKGFRLSVVLQVCPSLLASVGPEVTEAASLMGLPCHWTLRKDSSFPWDVGFTVQGLLWRLGALGPLDRPPRK